MKTKLTKKQEAQMIEIVTRIAQEELYVETLNRRWSDSLDFYEVSVWSLKEALEKAYQAGRASVN